MEGAHPREDDPRERRNISLSLVHTPHHHPCCLYPVCCTIVPVTLRPHTPSTHTAPHTSPPLIHIFHHLLELVFWRSSPCCVAISSAFHHHHRVHAPPAEGPGVTLRARRCATRGHRGKDSPGTQRSAPRKRLEAVWLQERFRFLLEARVRRAAACPPSPFAFRRRSYL